MPFTSSRPEQFRRELELVEPIDLASFNRLYIAITKAISKDPSIRYQEPGAPAYEFYYGEKFSESDYEIGRSRKIYDINVNPIFISVEAECSPEQISYGLMARVNSMKPSEWSIYALTVNKGLHYITEEYSGEPIESSEFARIVEALDNI
jgi:hypothetical protein